MKKETPQVAIVGGGVSGATMALHFGKMGIPCTLFEQERYLISGPPFCHLHAGGNLYREISDMQCITLLKQSIDFIRYYPFIVDYRPTVIAIPVEDKGSPEDLLPRLKLLTQTYKTHIAKDAANEVLGAPETYYRTYSRTMMEKLRHATTVTKPKTFDEWIIPVAKQIDFEKVKFPLILVQEYGLNLFRLSAGLSLALSKIGSVNLMPETRVTSVKHQHKKWYITFKQNGHTKTETFDYLINAAGFRTGYIDDMIGVPCQSMVEFKAAYVSKWEKCCDALWPEIIFHGERGTPRGMGQFTPYPEGYFQLHGMTKEITLYEDGLVANTPFSCQPQLKQDFIEKIERQWRTEEVEERTHNAIEHLAKYIPHFSKAQVGSKPLFGAQQIPGSDPTLRVAEVSFPAEYYARCEVVKVSSVLDMVDAIHKKLHTLGLVNDAQKVRNLEHLTLFDEETLATKAAQIAQARHYPVALSKRNVTQIST
ncbi:MAG: FAD-binding oxidoreductase [Sulfurovum sp.]|nr:FAD-binding oxidoreductase [Sulfurovum sp.]